MGQCKRCGAKCAANACRFVERNCLRACMNYAYEWGRGIVAFAAACIHIYIGEESGR
jgi:hypothetical protein